MKNSRSIIIDGVIEILTERKKFDISETERKQIDLLLNTIVVEENIDYDAKETIERVGKPL